MAAAAAPTDAGQPPVAGNSRSAAVLPPQAGERGNGAGSALVPRWTKPAINAEATEYARTRGERQPWHHRSAMKTTVKGGRRCEERRSGKKGAEDQADEEEMETGQPPAQEAGEQVAA